MTRAAWKPVIPFVVLLIGSLVAVVPLIGVVLLALQPPTVADARIDIAQSFHLDNLAAAWEQGGFAASIPTSLLLCLGVLVLTIPLSVAAAYGLVTLRAPFRAAITVLLVTGIFLPIEAYVVPLFFDLRVIGLGDTLWGTILAVAALNVAFGAFWMRSFFLTAPEALVDAGRIDGANAFRILTSILVPIARPHILALTVLMFIWTWNDLLTPMVLLSSSDLRTVPMSLGSFTTQNTTNYVLTAGAAIITMVPVLIVYLVLQRSFVRGIVDGSTR